MAFPTNALKVKYQELSDLFITDVNNNQIVLYFPQTSLTSNTINVSSPVPNFDSYGGRQSVDNFIDRVNSSGNQLNQSNITGIILGRTYWTSQKFDQNGNLISDDNTCKVITYSENSQKIVNAEYAVINEKKVKLIKLPSPYGLFGKQYCISFWKII